MNRHLLALTYLPRRFVWIIRDPGLPCLARSCARPTVGHSVWCRHHTNRILNDHDLEDWE